MPDAAAYAAFASAASYATASEAASFFASFATAPPFCAALPLFTPLFCRFRRQRTPASASQRRLRHFSAFRALRL